MVLITIVVPKDTLEDPKFKSVFGSIYGGIKTETRFQRAQPLLVILRRGFLVFIGLFMFEHPGQ
jgi:hypothetical protein